MKWLFTLLCCCVLNGYGGRTGAFTIHPDGRPVNFYSDPEMKDIRITVFPYKAEANVGIMVEVVSELENVLVVQMGIETFFCKKGELAVNTRNYTDQRLILYLEPDLCSQSSVISQEQQTVKIYGIHDEWFLVEAKDEQGRLRQGWLPPDKQCWNPWTTCP